MLWMRTYIHIYIGTSFNLPARQGITRSKGTVFPRWWPHVCYNNDGFLDRNSDSMMKNSRAHALYTRAIGMCVSVWVWMHQCLLFRVHVQSHLVYNPKCIMRYIAKSQQLYYFPCVARSAPSTQPPIPYAICACVRGLLIRILSKKTPADFYFLRKVKERIQTSFTSLSILCKKPSAAILI